MPEHLVAALAGRYEVERELGRGGMATVYLARDVKHARYVALKVLRPDLAATLGAERFLREIQLAAGLQHPHVLAVHDSGEAAGFLYYVMPYVEGESLRQRLTREGQLPLEDAIQIVREVADALAYAHSRNVVHRDIKPENILLQSGHAVVADFGIARAIEAAGGERLTQTGIAVGTPAYMSPEQASGDPRIDGRSDLYSLGCVLYEMLGGEPPHTGPSPQAILARQLAGEVRSLVPLRSSVSPELEAALRRALTPAPADRYATAQDFAAAIAGATVRAVPLQAVQRRVPLRRVLAGVAAVGALAVAAVLIGRRLVAPSLVDDGRLGVAVFPFRATGGGAGEWSEALGDLLATALDGTPGVRVADPWSLWQGLRRERGARAESPDPEEAERLARGARAASFVLGSVVETGGRLDLTVRIYRAGVPSPLETLAAAASVDSLVALVQRVAVDVITRLFGERDSVPRVPPLERYATHSAEALKAYLDAKEAMRRGLVDEADRAVDRAVALDSTFALALVEAAVVKTWVQFMRGQVYQGLLEYAQRAVRHSDSLSERNRLRARAVLASILTDGPRAAEAAERVVRLDSTDFEAWSSLAYYHQVYGWQYGRDERDAIAAAERAVRLDSTSVPSLVGRAWLAAAIGDADDIGRQLARLRAADTANVLVRGNMLGLRAVLASDREFDGLADTIAMAAPAEWLAVARYLRAVDPARAGTLLRRLEASAGPGFPQQAAQGMVARLKIAQGRLAGVDSAVVAGAYDAAALARHLDRFLVASAVAGVGHEPATRRALERLRYISPDSAQAQFERLPVWWTGWVVGAYHAMYGDTAVTRRWRSAIGTLPCCEGSTSRDWVGALQSDLDARLAARRGRIDTALVLTQRALDLWTIHTDNQLEAFPEPAMRLQLALLLRATGRPDSAAALLRSLVPPTTWMGFLTARASFELGSVAEERGDLREAARRYDAALSLWRLGGPEVADWRRRAEAGLERALRRAG